MKTYIIISLISFYISLGILLRKTGFNIIQSFLPVLNIYNFSKVIKTNIFIIIALVLCCIFLPIRNLIMTILYVFLPFLISYYYGLSNKVAFVTIIIPFIGYPYIALKGYYYDTVL